jgi:hypothetical protein
MDLQWQMDACRARLRQPQTAQKRLPEVVAPQMATAARLRVGSLLQRLAYRPSIRADILSMRGA